MENKILCQSCANYIGFDTEKGTENDGTLSKDYCSNCYVKGKFTDEKINLEEMIVKSILKAKKNNQDIEKAKKLYIKFLPTFKRWKENKLDEKKLETLLDKEENNEK